jgi:hypothetical protein
MLRPLGGRFDFGQCKNSSLQPPLGDITRVSARHTILAWVIDVVDLWI